MDIKDRMEMESAVAEMSPEMSSLFADARKKRSFLLSTAEQILS